MLTLEDLKMAGTPANARRVVVTDEIAQAIKGMLSHNRPVSTKAVDAMAADMTAGQWKDNGETIKFNRNGEPFDGQHRIIAAIKSGVPVVMTMIFDCDEDGVDWGRTRSAADVVSIKYMLSNSADVCATAAFILRYENTAKGATKLVGSTCATTRKSVVVERASSDLRIAGACSCVGSNKKWAGWMPRSVMATVLYFARKTSPEVAEEFVRECRDGEGLVKGSPALALRNALMNPLLRRHGVNRDWALALTAKAWLAREVDKSITLLKYLDVEEFPRFRCDNM